MNHISIDFDRSVGAVKRMHAVNNVQNVPFDLYGGIDLLAEAKVPYARLHDTGYYASIPRVVNIHEIFSDFDADENDPASYDFSFTDVLLSEMVKKGIKPFYRLGETIENYHKIKTYYIYPPKDFAKWARICEHIILHYNEGWADGFHMDIEYWEIWNEPENDVFGGDNQCWKGTKEQFFELYRVASVYLKEKFPHLKIGGYASSGFYALTNTYIQAANSSPRKEYFLEFFEDFLEYSKNNNCILDFFSWHSYAGVEKNPIYARHIRERLDAYGFADSEVFLNEWNPGIKNRGTARDAADVLAMMIAMQNTPTDMCMYYDAAEHSVYCGIFDPVTHGVFKAYYSFFIFGQMYAMGEQCFTQTNDEKLFAMAAKASGKKAFVIVNDSDCEKTVEISVNGADASSARVKAIDSMHTFDEAEILKDTVVLPPYAIRYVEFD